MLSETNKTVSRRFFEEVFGKGKMNVLDEIIAKDHVNLFSGEPFTLTSGTDEGDWNSVSTNVEHLQDLVSPGDEVHRIGTGVEPGPEGGEIGAGDPRLVGTRRRRAPRLGRHARVRGDRPRQLGGVCGGISGRGARGHRGERGVRAALRAGNTQYFGSSGFCRSREVLR